MNRRRSLLPPRRKDRTLAKVRNLIQWAELMKFNNVAQELRTVLIELERRQDKQ